MPMTKEQIAEILSGMTTCESNDSAEDHRRRAIRVKHREPVTIIPYQDGLPRTPQVATMVDFSSRGVALHFLQPIVAGGHFLLVLPSILKKPVQLLCDVVHCQRRDDGKFAIGAEFVGVTTAAAAAAASRAFNACEATRISDHILG